MATSVGGVLTGRGADVIIIDDPLKPDQALSEVGRKAVNDWYDNTLLSRLVRARRRGNGSKNARRSFCRSPTITSSSLCRRRSAPSRCGSRAAATMPGSSQRERRSDQSLHVANMPMAATPITAVASQPSALSNGRSANWPMICFREAISMIMTMIGTAATPLMTALQHGQRSCRRIRRSRVGTTLIAPDRTKRVCRGVELDPLYIDVIIRRYDAATGNPAILIETGETFEPLSARRAREAASV